jgi:hypothetical protein
MDKKFFLFGMAAILGASLVFFGCDQGDTDNTTDDPIAGVDKPLSGEMSKDTAKKIFDFEELSDGAGVNITKFKSASALREYLKPTQESKVAESRFAILFDEDADTRENFLIKKIGGLPVVSIANGAFKPATTNGGDDDITTVVKAIALPDTITDLGNDIFGDVQYTLTVDIPPAVVKELTKIDPEGGEVNQAALAEALQKLIGERATIEVKQVDKIADIDDTANKPIGEPIAPTDPPDGPPKPPITTPEIGIVTTDFDKLKVALLPDSLAGIKTSTENHGHIILDGMFRCVSGDKITEFRTAGGVPVTWNHSETADANTFWQNDNTLTNVRVDVTLTTSDGGDKDAAYLLAYDGENTFEVIEGGFFGL